MALLNFKVEWENVQGIVDPALAKSWSRFSITSDERTRPFTYCIDTESGSSRDGVYGSLLPLGEWLLRHWHDVLDARREALNVPPSQRAWRRRHAWRTGREGMAFPDLTTFRRGSEVVFRTRRDDEPLCGIALCFLTDSELTMPRGIAEQMLRGLLDRLTFRLEECSDPRAIEFREDYDRLRRMDEHAHRRLEVIARLGLEEAQLSEDEALAGLVDELQLGRLDPLSDALVDAADPAVLAQDLRWAKQAWAVCEQEPPVSIRLRRLRDDLARQDDTPARSPSWERGWGRAEALRRVRPEFSHYERPVDGMRELCRAESLTTVAPSKVPTPEDSSLEDGVAWASGRQPLFFSAPRLATAAQNFRLARDLHGALFEGDPNEPFARLASPYLATALSEANAFAAELLAPVDLLRKRLQRNRLIDNEQVQRLANELVVSSRVIEHQIENHRLGSLVMG